MNLTVTLIQGLFGIAISITVLLTVGVTVGRVLESIKNNRKELADSLETFRTAISDMVEGLVSRVETAEAFMEQDGRRSENYRMWRINKNKELRRISSRTERVAGRVHDIADKQQQYELALAAVVSRIKHVESTLNIKEN